MPRGFSHYCAGCERKSSQKVLFRYVNHRIDEEIPTEYTFTECRRCGGPNLFMREDEGFGFPRGAYEYLFPGDGRDMHGVLPFEAWIHYRKAVEYEQGHKWDAVVLEVGRSLEALVQHLAPKVRGLAAGLAHLRKLGVFSEELFQWADQIRVLRNQSAHPSQESFSARDAKSAFDFLDGIAHTLYYTRMDFESFKRQRTDAKKA
jgi:hypothetical protein